MATQALEHSTRPTTFYFMVSLILLIVLYPFLEGGSFSFALLNLLASLVLIAGVYVSSESKKHFITGIALGAPAIIFNWLGLLVDNQLAVVASVAFTVAFYVFITVTLFVSLLKGERVTSKQIYAAICVYLLLGITWGAVYTAVEKFQPNSFFVSEAQNIDGVIDGSDLLYFSFVTLTTVGYGDITPVTTYVRSFAVLEAGMGVLYVAVLVSRLVGVYKPRS
jgi:voltage-gated potassium channel